MNNPFNLNRFVEAQEPVYDRVLAELRHGRKTGHWIWFVFPQIDGLGHSAMAQRFAITSLEEAKAYLDHPLLGTRLLECTGLVCQLKGRSVREILGTPDDMKFRSCMTLFCRASSDPRVFEEALQMFFGGEPDPLTLERIAG
jgi:uncharacterized protein (DUF1810 family)